MSLSLLPWHDERWGILSEAVVNLDCCYRGIDASPITVKAGVKADCDSNVLRVSLEGLSRPERVGINGLVVLVPNLLQAHKANPSLVIQNG